MGDGQDRPELHVVARQLRFRRRARRDARPGEGFGGDQPSEVSNRVLSHPRRWAVRFSSFAIIVALGGSLAATSLHAQVTTTIVNDSWTDGGRTDGADLLDSDWWTSSSTSGIEVSTGSLGMVTGTTGRGIHTVFPTQTLANVGDSLKATYTFATPATVGTGTAAF